MLAADAILYEDDDLLVVNKPAGLVVHASRMANQADTDLITELRAVLKIPLYPAHRLDRATSGLILIAKNGAIAGELGKQFMSRSIDKRYLAVCRGWPTSPGEIDYALRDPDDANKSWPALTRFEVLGTTTVPIALGKYPSQRYALLDIRPETGRYRQIRRHFHHISHHLIGDTSHGRSEHNRLFQAEFDCDRLLLHAFELVFRLPRSGQSLCLRAPLDASFTRILERFGWSLPAPGNASQESG